MKEKNYDTEITDTGATFMLCCVYPVGKGSHACVLMSCVDSVHTAFRLSYCLARCVVMTYTLKIYYIEVQVLCCVASCVADSHTALIL